MSACAVRRDRHPGRICSVALRVLAISARRRGDDDDAAISVSVRCPDLPCLLAVCACVRADGC